MLLTSIAYSVFMNKCPQCHRGKVLSYAPYKLTHLLETEQNCTACGLKFEKEPGFFYGAMYVSYALTSGIFIVAYLLQSNFIKLPVTQFAIAVIVLILLLFPLIARWSRLLWLNFFVSYNPKVFIQSKSGILK